MDHVQCPRTLFEKIWEAHIVQEGEQNVLLFALDAFRKEALLQGLDPIDRTLLLESKIAAFEARRKQEVPSHFV